jgi:hypothetical protein
MKSCGQCGAQCGDVAVKCANCQAFLIAAPAPVAPAAPAWGATPSAPPPPTWNQPPVAPPAPWTPAAPAPNTGWQSPHTGWQSPYTATPASKKTAPVKVWVKRGAFVAAALFGFSLVVGYLHERSDPYSHASQEAFVAGCKHGGGTEGTCRCAFGWIKQNVPAADFKAFDKLAASPDFKPSQAPPWVFQAASACRGR